MKFLIAGLGSIGRRHFRNLRLLGAEDILLYRTHRATLPDEELSGFPVFTDLHKALAQGPAAVFVCNPTAFHLDVAIPAARAGCHIFLEKPVSHSFDRLDELEAAAAAAGGRIFVGFQFRFHPGLRQVKGWLEDTAIGQPVALRAHWGEYLPNWHPWEDYRLTYAARPELGGGVALTLCHPLDYLRWLFGEPESLWAFTSRAGLGLEVEDIAEIGLRFTNEAIASVHLDYIQRPPRHTLEIIGRNGTITWDNASGIARLYQASTVDKDPVWQEFTPPHGFERNTMFLDEVRHFLQVASGAAEPLCDLQDGKRTLQIVQACYQSAQQNRRVSFEWAGNKR